MNGDRSTWYLFTVTAIDEEGEGKMKVQIIPGSELTVPLEVVTIEPPYVMLVNKPEVEAPQEDEKEQVEETIENPEPKL